MVFWLLRFWRDLDFWKTSSTHLSIWVWGTEKNGGDLFIRVTKVHFGYECHIWNLNHEQALIASWETKKGSLACEEKTLRDSPIFKANPLWNMSRVPIWKKSNAQRRGWCLLLALWTRSYMSVREFYSILSESNWSNFLNVHLFITKLDLFFPKWYSFLQNVGSLFFKQIYND